MLRTAEELEKKRKEKKRKEKKRKEKKRKEKKRKEKKRKEKKKVKWSSGNRCEKDGVIQQTKKSDLMVTGANKLGILVAFH